MNRQKGVSQVLALIIAAAVLMMAALTLIFLTQSSLGDSNENKKASTCQQIVQSKCQIEGSGSTIQTPSACLEEGSVPTAIQDGTSISIGDSTTNCP